ncbi:MAG: orotidine-5'-phosphate decarboxylase [Pseudomonadales bacterium]|jgi:orotidine-5'-phosphate decarboxylase
MPTHQSPVIVALDVDNAHSALMLAEQLNPAECRLKVGKELFTACGPNVVQLLVQRNFDVFLDLKFHDIPTTVAHALKAARDLGVWMVNVHASGGTKMLEAARAALQEKNDPLLIAVTVLTSMDQHDLQQIGISESLDKHIVHLAGLAANAGLDGVVCSARESTVLRDCFGSDFCQVTPGIRPVGSAVGDQSRIMTPREALDNGSHYLVIGRPITQAENPAAALQAINASLLL